MEPIPGEVMLGEGSTGRAQLLAGLGGSERQVVSEERDKTTWEDGEASHSN